MSSLGEFIKKKRLERGIKQKELAEHLGFSSVFMGRIESGKNALPIAYTHKLSKRLGVSVDELFKLIKRDVSERLRLKIG